MSIEKKEREEERKMVKRIYRAMKKKKGKEEFFQTGERTTLITNKNALKEIKMHYRRRDVPFINNNHQLSFSQIRVLDDGAILLSYWHYMDVEEDSDEHN